MNDAFRAGMGIHSEMVANTRASRSQDFQERQAKVRHAMQQAQAAKIMQEFELGRSVRRSFQQGLTDIDSQFDSDVQKIDATEQLIGDYLRNTDPKIYAENVAPIVDEMKKLSRFKNAESVHNNVAATQAKWNAQFGKLSAPLTPSGSIDMGAADLAFKFAKAFPGEQIPLQVEQGEGGVRSLVDYAAIQDRLKKSRLEGMREDARYKGMIRAEETKAELDAQIAAVGPPSDDPEIDMIRKSAVYDSKPMGSWIDNFGKLASVHESSQTIGDLLKEVPTGPWRSKLADLKEFFTGESDMSVLRAEINKLIPNLARGVYGEVGVLTDADIEHYKKTVASTSSSTELNKTLIEITKKAALNKMKSMLLNQAEAGNNVSGYLKRFEKIKSAMGDLPRTGESRVFSLDDLPD